MKLLDWLFGHDYAYLVVGLFFISAVLDVLFYHLWLLPKASAEGNVNTPEARKALVSLWLPLYLGALCCVLIGVVGIIYHQSLPQG